MKSDVTSIPAELLKEHTSPCISIYMPTNRRYPENAQDSLRFKDLVGKAKNEGDSIVGKRSMEPLLERLTRLHNDHSFWTHSLDGLAVFVSPDFYKVFLLQEPVSEQIHVSDVFYVKPLIRIFQTADRFQVLSITRTDVKFYEGNRYKLDEIVPAVEVPRTMTEALGYEITPPHQTVAGFGNVGSNATMRHGHSSRKDEEEIDDENFFRAVDRAVTAHHSKPSGLPLILAALPDHQSLFRSISHNPYLVEDGVDDDPRLIEPEELRDKAWAVLEPMWQGRIDELIARYEEAQSKSLGSEDPFEIARAAVEGNVWVLLIDNDRVYPGAIDTVSGDIEFSKEPEVHDHDVLEDLAVTAIRNGGEVLVLPSERMPSDSGVAAIFRHR
jgi:hypothetical protein